MNESIAVFLQDDEHFVSFLDSTKIIVLEKKDVWIKKDTILLPSTFSANPTKLRDEISGIISKLNDCKIIAGLEMLGIPYCVFNSFDFEIFSINQLNDDILNGIIDDINSNNEQSQIKNNIIKNTMPIQTDIDGVYFLDLISLQTQCPEISSKKALYDFLINTPFIELHLLCKHIPPWLYNGKYDIISKKTAEDDFLAIIRKQICEEVLQ